MCILPWPYEDSYDLCAWNSSASVVRNLLSHSLQTHDRAWAPEASAAADLFSSASAWISSRDLS